MYKRQRLDRDTKKAVGVFYHNFYESVFNMGREKSNYWPRYTYFQADGGDLDCFLIGGDTIARVVDNYTLLTGRPALLPKRCLLYTSLRFHAGQLQREVQRFLRALCLRRSGSLLHLHGQRFRTGCL